MSNAPIRQIFLSHSSTDKALARQVAAAFTLRGIPVFLDEQSITPGEDYQESIMNAVSTSSALVALLSRASMKSKNVVREIALADELGLPVFPLTIEPLRFPEDYPKNLHYRLLHLQIGAYRSADDAVDLVERALIKSPGRSNSSEQRSSATHSGDAARFVGQWVKCIETSDHSRSFLVEVHPDGTATESHLFGDPADQWPGGWQPRPTGSGAVTVDYWGDFDHGYYATRVTERADGMFWGVETAHPPGEPEGPTQWTTRVVFVRVH